jgi:hypothetical protein
MPVYKIELEIFEGIGGTLLKDGERFENEIESDGVTTEYARCIDPTASGIVVKLIRIKI